MLLYSASDRFTAAPARVRPSRAPLACAPAPMAEGGGAAPAAAAPKNINKSNESSTYFGRLAQELGVAPAVVQSILEHIRRMAIDDLRSQHHLWSVSAYERAPRAQVQEQTLPRDAEGSL